ncbi:related to MTQ2-Putative S-adenosylmethionine-dependent methyltransferase [Sporisorium reilianum f. sp. reilianum]|uniref:Related to MTQ2-Putative S-adenosylmethionine-dependent methyltransferase n=1 Tax=Sporisorium reilianum f. sp. reilianum TaxID=72559 RepID=A0A2N8UBH6_9BASI|nr:related to MTQ2-Putative S-adenosylmethionine-dependent methyltransferase [Sporisorium reilianum f. sp. reilianum]
MIPTPTLTHLTKQDYRRVYEPAEDTFILLDALEADASSLTTTSSPLCLEIGSGSGIVTSFLSHILGPTSAAYLAIDFNPHANTCTLATGRANSVRIEAVRSSLLDGLRARLKGQVDVLLFNPPYVPTEEEEELLAQSKAGIEGAWAGGATGTRLVDALIDGGAVKDVLASRGRFYLVAIKQNDPAGLVRRLAAQGLDAAVVLARRAGGEHLHVVRAIKP